MTEFSLNIVTHFPSLSLGILFKNPNNTNDPNIYVLFSGHVCQTDDINVTFLTFQNKTVDAKILNVNIWIDVACAVIVNQNDIDFPVTTVLLQEPIFTLNQPVTYFSNYDINNSLPLPITSTVRVPNFLYPQDMINFFYPDSILLKEGQGVTGLSGGPVIDSNNMVVALISKIVGENGNNSINKENNLVCTKMSMVYNYLFDPTNGLISRFFQAYLSNPTINENLNLLVAFRNSFNIIICHLGFLFKTYKIITSGNTLNLSPSVNGILLRYRYTGITNSDYSLVNYLQKNDAEITYFRSLLDNSDIMNDYYKNKTSVILKTLNYTDKYNKSVNLDLGEQSITNYYVNGDPSKSITIGYYVYSPSGLGGVNMSFGPLKTITINPFIVNDGGDNIRYTSQLPKIFTSTSSKVNNVMSVNLYNQTFGIIPYAFIYSAIIHDETTWDKFKNFYATKTGKGVVLGATSALSAKIGYRTILEGYRSGLVYTNISRIRNILSTSNDIQIQANFQEKFDPLIKSDLPWYSKQYTKINELAKATESSLKSRFLTQSDFQTISQQLRLRPGSKIDLSNDAYQKIQQFLDSQIKGSGARIKDIEAFESPQFTPGEVAEEIRDI